MSRLCFIILAVLVVFAVANVDGKIRCSKNEVWTRSKSTCQRTCANPRGICGPNWLKTPGCRCRYGFIRNNNGHCVKKSKCPVAKSNKKILPKVPQRSLSKHK